MRGCICKNEREEILLVGRKTSDRVGIRRGGFRVADTHIRTRACMFAQWMRKTSFSSLLDSVNFKILLKNPFLFLSFFFSSIFLPRTHYRMQTIRQPMETRKYCPSPLSLLSSQSVSKITRFHPALKMYSSPPCDLDLLSLLRVSTLDHFFLHVVSSRELSQPKFGSRRLFSFLYNDYYYYYFFFLEN